MTDTFFDPIVIGHNSFFGVDHLSSVRGQLREAYFAVPERILEVITWSVSHGAGGMMMSTHSRATAISELLRTNKQLADTLKIYPLLPYVQKYVVAANEKGMLNVITDSISGTSSGEKLRMLWNGAMGVLRNDLHSMLSALIQMELKPFKGLNMPCVFLHDVFTDLAISLELKDIVEFYHEEMANKYGTRAAFATKNLPLFLQKFRKWGFDNPLVMPHVNKIGFSMNPSRQACEEALRTYRVRVMAMSTLASGHLKPDEAYEYLGQLPGIESVVVGVSSLDHVQETFSAIKRHMKPHSSSRVQNEQLDVHV